MAHFLPFTVNLKRKKLVVGASVWVLWLLLWLIPWPPAVDAYGWIRLALAIGLFLFPGAMVASLIYRGEGVALSRSITLGFVLSIGFSSMLGLVAKACQLPPEVVSGGLWGLGAILIAVFTFLPGARGVQRIAWDKTTLLTLLPVAIAIGAACAVSIAEMQQRPLGFLTDDSTFNAYITEFRSEDRLDFGLDILDVGADTGTTRHWMINWPVSEAIIASQSDLPTIHLYLFIRLPLIIISFLAVYELARALGLPRSAALLTQICQACLLILMEQNNDQMGYRLLYVPTHGKTIVALIVAPVFFKICVDYLKTREQKYLLTLFFVGLGSQIIHITLSSIMLLVALVFVILSYAIQRQRRVIFLAIGVLVLIAVIPAPLRFLTTTGENFYFDISSAQDNEAYSSLRSRRLTTLDNERFYGVSPELLRDAAYIPLAFGALLALGRLKHHFAAVYITAILIVMLIAINPYTGWLLGLAITPFHIWRVTWFIPFGIATAFVVDSGSQLLQQSKSVMAQKWAAYLTPLVGLLLVIVTLFNLPDWFSPDLVSAQLPPDYDALIQAADWLNTETEGEIIVVGNRQLNDHVPGMSARAQTIVFRSAKMTADFGSLSAAEARQRTQEWQLLLDDSTDSAERGALLRKYRVDYLLLTKPPAWIQDAREMALEIRLVANFDNRVFLYAVEIAPVLDS